MQPSYRLKDQKPATELKGSAFSLTVVRLLSSELEEVERDLRDKLATGPRFFANAPVVVDLDRVRDSRPDLDLPALMRLLKDLALVPVGVRHATPAQQEAAVAAGFAVVKGGWIRELPVAAAAPADADAEDQTGAAAGDRAAAEDSGSLRGRSASARAAGVSGRATAPARSGTKPTASTASRAGLSGSVRAGPAGEDPAVSQSSSGASPADSRSARSPSPDIPASDAPASDPAPAGAGPRDAGGSEGPAAAGCGRSGQDAAQAGGEDSPASDAPPRATRAAGSSVRAKTVYRPVRSGQQIYAEDSDLVVLAAVNAGAEVMADGDVHIYGPLRGRALAGAKGDRGARIFCQNMGAELVAIAGRFQVLDESVPAEVRGRAVQVYLDGERVRFDLLS